MKGTGIDFTNTVTDTKELNIEIFIMAAALLSAISIMMVWPMFFLQQTRQAISCI